MSISNGIDAQVAQRWLGEALRIYKELDDLKIDNMDRAKKIRSRLPDIYDAAKNAGLPLRAFKQSIKKVLIERKIEGLQEDIEGLVPEDEDDAAAYDMLQAALGSFGDTPLGAATLDQAATKKEKAAAKKRIKDEERTRAEAAKLAKDMPSGTPPANDDAAIVEQNTERLEAGITPIPAKEPFEDDAAAAKPSRAQRRAGKLDDLTKH